MNNLTKVKTTKADESHFWECVGDAHFDDFMQDCIEGTFYCPVCYKDVTTYALVYEEVPISTDQNDWLFWFASHYQNHHTDNPHGVEWVNELLTRQWQFTSAHICKDKLTGYLEKYYPHLPELVMQVNRTFDMNGVYK